MVIGIFGESCTGKSTLAQKIAGSIPCEVFAGKDYLRLAKNESIAKVLFQKKLTSAVNGENIVYVISEKEHLSLLPQEALRVLVTADLELIKSRFSQRMGGNLPVQLPLCWKGNTVLLIINLTIYMLSPGKQIRMKYAHRLCNIWVSFKIHPKAKLLPLPNIGRGILLHIKSRIHEIYVLLI